MTRATTAEAQFEEMTRCVCSALRQTTRGVTNLYDRALKRHGLRATQLPILLAARGDRAVPLGPMAARLGMDRTTLVRNVRPLLRRGLLVQSTDGRSRRTTLRTTAAGRTLLRRVYPDWSGVQERLIEAVGPSALSRALGALAEVARGAPS